MTMKTTTTMKMKRAMVTTMTTMTGRTKQAKTRTTESTICEPVRKVETNEIAMKMKTTKTMTTRMMKMTTTKMMMITKV